MIVTNTDLVPNKEIVEVLNIVKGNTIRAKHLGKDIMSSFKHLVGGELNQYTEMIDEARDVAYDKMVMEAKEMGADAIVSVRFSTSAIAQGAAEVLCYGTAVKLVDK
ncbi:YbjQ family protein [Isachenkonia alkalipeptolytica]|uniref:UPF0145 protein ISALK_04000 n=1 Tax=Isachenkonia alkalipeptolytica TaxID=2565777 RepID=A0AA44BD81_9CLOT|nr:heavy metal-binding domain-containing protein [Isachenkonia alkalipeptolytica]NBG87657.1 YbjQ family protein [Isachenkonia alkalipeptolytica]